MFRSFHVSSGLLSAVRARPTACRPMGGGGSEFRLNVLVVQWYPFPFFGSRPPYKFTNPKKGALIVIWFLGYSGEGAGFVALGRLSEPFLAHVKMSSSQRSASCRLLADFGSHGMQGVRLAQALNQIPYALNPKP